MLQAQQGDLLEFRFEFRRNIPGRPLVTPDVIHFQLKRGSLDPDAELTYTGATTPDVGVIAIISTGRFIVLADSTDAAGIYVPKAWSTGNGQAAVPPESVEVIPAPF